GDALDRCDLYPQIWSYWLEKFADDPEVFEAIKRIEGKMENKVVKNALKGDANATMSIFVLKNKHDWKDKTEADVNVRKSYGAMSDEELEAEYERLEAISKAGTKED
ncbi:hypothetical protein KC887_08230, partial [Candidatus Kaiserbacteria bacterium]|nr:hypothetical protein [Candidatus Kaiserbacteria bacterium]